MEDVFKNFIYTSVGLVSVTAERVQEAMDKLQDDNKISNDEGKKILEDFFTNTEAKAKEFEEKLKSVTQEVLSNFNLNVNKSHSSLEDRIKVIEDKLGITAPVKEEAKSATKKAPAKKPVAKKEAAKA